MNPNHLGAARTAGRALRPGAPLDLISRPLGQPKRAAAVLRGVLAAVLSALTLCLGAVSARADATVDTNSFAALAAAMAQGGTVTFTQDGTITFTNTLMVTNPLTLDSAGHAVTLNGSAMQLFRVYTPPGSGTPANLTLNGFTLTGGRNTNGGALYVGTNATVLLTNCVLTGNTAGSSLTNVANLGFTNDAFVFTNYSAVLQVRTNFSTNTLTLDPISGLFLTNTYTLTQTLVQTNNLLGFTNTVPTAGVRVTNLVFSTNTVTFTNVLTSTNITLLTNVYDTLLATNLVADIRTIVEHDTNLVTTFLIPATRVVPAPGSDGPNGSNSSFGRGGGGGNGRAGLPGCGGAIYNRGKLWLLNCTFSTNNAIGGNGGDGGDGGSGSFKGGNGGNGGKGNDAFGGALYNDLKAQVIIQNCSFNYNTAASGSGGTGGAGGSGAPNGVAGNGGAAGLAYGGAIYNLGFITNSASTFFANGAVGGDSAAGGTGSGGGGNSGPRGGNAFGGAIYNGLYKGKGGAVAVTNCTFYGNAVSGGAGGDGGPSDWRAGRGGDGGTGAGGGLFNASTTVIINCSFWQNSATGGAKGVAGSGTFPSTDGSPGAAHGGNLATSNARLFIANSAIGATGGGHDAFGSVKDRGYNIWSDKSVSLSKKKTNPSSTSKNGTDPRFDSFGAFGGPTLTISLGTNSPVTNFIPVDGSTLVFVDQRGVTRPQYTNSAAGAVEESLMPWLLASPQDVVQTNGGNALFKVLAAGAGLTYQWRLEGADIAGATTSYYGLTNLTSANQGTFDVVISNAFGCLTSAPCLLTLGAAPSITVPPAAQTLPQGSNAVFTVTAQGTAPLLYQWQLNGQNLSGACGTDLTNYTVANVQAGDAGPYSVVVSNRFGSVTSAPAALAVLTAPEITTNPVSRTVLVGSNVTFSVAAIGSPPLTYQWRENQIVLGGGVSPTHICYDVHTSDSGSYDVVVTDANGSVTSSPAVLTVLAPVSLSGRLTDAVTAAGLPGVTVNLTNELGILSTNTDAYGYYVFTNLWPGSTNTVFPVAACEVFQPAFTNLVLPQAADATADFTGLTNVFTIQGQVTNSLGGISGVSVQLTNETGSQTFVTVGAGYYAFSYLCPGTYRLTASAPGYQFAPATLSVTVGPDTNNVNFAALPVFNVTGQVVNGAGGSGLGGVAVFLNSTNAAQTDANGYFTITNLPAGAYDLSPLLDCYSFAPATATLVVGSASANTTNFVASSETYQLGGSLYAGTNTLVDFTVKLTGPNLTRYFTLTNGFYLFTNLCPGFYTVAPQALGCYQFYPPSRTIQLGPDNIAQNFTVLNSAASLSASGRITILQTNALPGVTVGAAGTNVASAATTDDTGVFHVVALCPGVYELVPSLPGYRFTPASRQVVLGADTNGLDFAALPVLSLASSNGSPVQLSFPTLPGLSYTLTASSNLLDWLSLLTTNVDSTGAASWVSFSDLSSTQAPVRFYRLGDAAPVTNAPAVRLKTGAAR